jgi:gamma-glutamyltranspeptidase
VLSSGERRLGLATPHVAATEAGQSIFAAGGNAVDAAVAAAAVLTVVYPHMCTMGGDLFALVFDPKRGAVGFNASGAAPRDRTAEDLRRAHGQMPAVGPDTVTVPGILGGWESLHAWAGRLSWEAIIQRAGRLAEAGCSVSPSLAAALREVADLAAGDEGMSEIFFREGRPISEGETFVQPALARTLDEVAKAGSKAFYEGDTGASYVRGLQRLGCRLSRDDLCAYETSVVEPLSGDFRGWEVLTVPPNSQGYTLLQTLCAWRQLDLNPDPLSADASQVARIFSRVAAERDRALADPRRMHTTVAELLSEEHVLALLDASDGAESSPSVASDTPKSAPSGDTIAVVAVDDEGLGVSIIQSVFEAFGACLLEPSTGIVAQNRGACFTLDPASPNVFAGGQRPLHTLMPVMVKRNGRLRIVAGTMGGRAQFQIHAQILARLLCDRAPLQDALDAPRWIVGDATEGQPSGVIYAEEEAARLVGSDLAGTGMQLKRLPDRDEWVGHAQYVEIDRDSRIAAACDPRSDGAAVVVA